MAPPVRSVLITLVVVVAAWVLQPATAMDRRVITVVGRPPAPTQASRAHGLAFDGVAAADQQVVLSAIASAQPEARRLLHAVDGLVTVRVGPTGSTTTAGFTQSTAAGYDVRLDLGMVSRTLGSRGTERLVLHELGHVVRFSLVSDGLLTQLDAGVPRGYGCEQGRTGACAAPEERFAESFAKWAMNDVGVNLEIGYQVPPPTQGLTAWASPLTRLDR